MSENEIGEFLNAGEERHGTSAKKDFIKGYEKFLKGDTNVDFYLDHNTKQFFLKGNQSGTWVDTGMKFE